MDSEVENKGTTFLNAITPKDEVLYLYDETKVAKQYTPLQFHYHAPSEHTIDGYLYDLELHIVHKNETAGELSVIGIFFDMKKGETRPILSSRSILMVTLNLTHKAAGNHQRLMWRN